MPETTNLKLPIFNPEDKPSWLGNWNGAMNTIDQAVGRIDGDVAEDKAEIEAAQAAADAAKAAADAASAGVTEVTGKVAAVETEVQSQGQMIEALQDDIAKIPDFSGISAAKIYNCSSVYLPVGSDVLKVGTKNNRLIIGSPTVGGVKIYVTLMPSGNPDSIANTQVFANVGNKEYYAFAAFKGNLLNIGVNKFCPLRTNDFWGMVYYHSALDVTILLRTEASNYTSRFAYTFIVLNDTENYSSLASISDIEGTLRSDVSDVIFPYPFPYA